MVPENENVFVSRGEGAGELSSSEAVLFKASDGEGCPAPSPWLKKTFSSSVARRPAGPVATAYRFGEKNRYNRPDKINPRSRSKPCPVSRPESSLSERGSGDEEERSESS